MSFPALTQNDLLDLWRSLFPSSYTKPIENAGHGQGFDTFASQAKIFARSADAANTTFGALYIRPHSTQTAPPAAGAARALTTLLVGRLPPTLGAIVLIAGTEFQAYLRSPQGDVLEGVRFRVVADTLIPAGSTGPTPVDVEASRVGYAGNVVEGSVTGFAARGEAVIIGATIEAGNVLRDTAGAAGTDRLTPAMIGQYVQLVGGLNGGTVQRRIISVTQPTTIDPTATALLDGAPLVFPDTTARAEVLEFVELGFTVEQPNAATGGLDGWLDALGEERNLPRQFGEDDETYRRRIIALDDTISPAAILRAASRILSPLGIGFRLLETRDFNGLFGAAFDFSPFDYGSIASGVGIFAPEVRFFILAVGFGGQGEFGCPFDSPYPSNAFDAPGDALNFFDGFPVLYMSAIATLWAEVNKKRAAGVGFVIVRDPSI